jgi:coiled-coil domain-containing protein 130
MFAWDIWKCIQFPLLIKDPQNTEYKLVVGLRKRIETYDADEIGVINLDRTDSERLAKDAFYRLEHNVKDAQKAIDSKASITTLYDANEKHWKDPYTMSQKVRKKFRDQKNLLIAQKAESQALQDKLGFAIPIVPKSEQDDKQAKKIDWDCWYF